MKNLTAFHGSQEVKDKYITRMKQHMAQDQLLQGIGFDKETKKGCAVGCTLDEYNHEAYVTELGVPIALAYVEDNIFEKLPTEESKTFPLEFLEAIPVGADLDKVYPLFFAWQMIDKKWGIINVLKNEEDKAAIQNLGDLYERLGTGQITFSEFKSADRADLDYLADLADRAYRAYRAYLAYLADRADYYPALRAKLIQLLKEAK